MWTIIGQNRKRNLCRICILMHRLPIGSHKNDRFTSGPRAIQNIYGCQIATIHANGYKSGMEGKRSFRTPINRIRHKGQGFLHRKNSSVFGIVKTKNQLFPIAVGINSEKILPRIHRIHRSGHPSTCSEGIGIFDISGESGQNMIPLCRYVTPRGDHSRHTHSPFIV